MNASRPEAETEYSRGPEPSRAPSGRRRSAVIALGLLGAAVLLAAELTPLLRVRTVAAHPRLIRTVQAGPHHCWALVPIAVAAVALSVLAWRSGSRAALAGVGLLGLAALGVALIADLPDAHSTGLVGSPVRGLAEAQAHAAIGLYLETLGAVALLVSAAAGAMLSGSLDLAPGRNPPRSGASYSAWRRKTRSAAERVTRSR